MKHLKSRLIAICGILKHRNFIFMGLSKNKAGVDIRIVCRTDFSTREEMEILDEVITGNRKQNHG